VRSTGTSLSRRFMQQTTQLKETAGILQSTLSTVEADVGEGSASTKRALTEAASQLETTAQLGRLDQRDAPTTSSVRENAFLEPFLHCK
jgi:hypothetical protein